MKKILVTCLTVCVLANAAPAKKHFDLTIENKTGGSHSCKLEFVSSLSNLSNVLTTKINSLRPGSTENIHLDFFPAKGSIPKANIMYTAKCGDFNAAVKIFITGRKYYADISPNNNLIFTGSTGSSITPKHIESDIIGKHSMNRLVIQQIKIRPLVQK